MILLFVFKDQIAKIFTYHQNVSDIISDSMPVIAAISVFQYIDGTGQGIIKAIGYQKNASIIVCISMWVVALPCTLIFGFYFKMRLKGLWLGFLVGEVLISIAYSFIILSVDWTKTTEDALIRIRKEKLELDKHEDIE